jgi:hypothetical protein
MSFQQRRATALDQPALQATESARRSDMQFGSNSDRARQLAAADPQAMLDAQAGDVDALLGGWSAFAPQLEVAEDGIYGSSAAKGAVDGALTAAMRDPAFAECAFGETTRDLRDAPHLMVESCGHSATAADLSGMAAAQLLAGLALEGWSEDDDLEAVFEKHIDDEGVYMNAVTLLATGEQFDWLEFFMGDTEVGYLFRAGTTSLVGCIGDGEIYDCPIRLPEHTGRSES